MDGEFFSESEKLPDASSQLGAFVAITKLLEIKRRADQDNFFPSLTKDKEAFVICELRNMQDFLTNTFAALFPNQHYELESMFDKLDEALGNTDYLLIKEFLSEIVAFVSLSSYAGVLELYGE